MEMGFSLLPSGGMRTLNKAAEPFSLATKNDFFIGSYASPSIPLRGFTLIPKVSFLDFFQLTPPSPGSSSVNTMLHLPSSAIAKMSSVTQAIPSVS